MKNNDLTTSTPISPPLKHPRVKESVKPRKKGAVRWYLLALVFGALLPLAFAPFYWWIVSIAAMTCFVTLLQRTRGSGAFWRSLFFGLGMFGTGASWVYTSIHTYGHASPILALSLTAAFVLALAIIFALPFVLYGKLENTHPLVMLLAFPSLWVLGEWWRGWVLTGFPWLYLGYTPLDTPLAHLAPITGVFGLSWVVAFAGALIAMILDHKRYQGHIGQGIFLLFVLAGGIFYLQKNPQTTIDPQQEPLKVTLMQPAIPLEKKWDQQAVTEILNQFLWQTEAHWSDSDLIIWPESAIPRFQDDVENFLTFVDAQAKDHNTAVITGIPYRQAPGTFYNSVIVLGQGTGTYHKRHLVPFGEYVPLEHWLRGTIRFFDLPMSSFQSGPDDQRPLSVLNNRIATAICYEIVYPDLVAKDAQEASLLLTISNDTWFGNSIGPHQHMQMARMRALENGKPLLRATNNGVTAVVDHRGQVTAKIPQFENTLLSAQVVPIQGSTFFSRNGSLPVLALCLLAFIGGFLVPAYEGPKEPKRRKNIAKAGKVRRA